MSFFDQTRPASPSVVRPMLGLVALFNTWNDRRVTRKSLSQLTNRELDDIGLHRGDIESM